VTEKPNYMKHRWIGYVLVTLLVPAVMLYFVWTLAYDNTGARIDRTAAFIANLSAAYKAYVADNGGLPQEVDNRQLYDAISGLGTNKYYMTFNAKDVNAKRELVDAWGIPLRVTRESDSTVKIESAGPDERFGTEDDIASK